MQKSLCIHRSDWSNGTSRRVKTLEASCQIDSSDWLLERTRSGKAFRSRALTQRPFSYVSRLCTTTSPLSNPKASLSDSQVRLSIWAGSSACFRIWARYSFGPYLAPSGAPTDMKVSFQSVLCSSYALLPLIIANSLPYTLRRAVLYSVLIADESPVVFLEPRGPPYWSNFDPTQVETGGSSVSLPPRANR